jgi:hypothetical protein
MWSRRGFFRLTGALSAGAWTVARNGLADVEAAGAAVAGRAPADIAQDELYWREIQEAFTLDRTISNLTERLHDARGDRYVRRRDARRAEERCGVTGPMGRVGIRLV